MSAEAEQVCTSQTHPQGFLNWQVYFMGNTQ